MLLSKDIQRQGGNMKECKSCHGTKKDFGTYNNKEKLTIPYEWETSKQSREIMVDSCMVTEIKWLWNNGIRTIECCCGHGVNNGYICVDDPFVEKMELLGYQNLKEKPERFDLFYPKRRIK
jgi:hypothetical protein